MDWTNGAHILLNKQKQKTALVQKEHVHWVKHWRSTQHGQHSIWEVSKHKKNGDDWVDWMWWIETMKHTTCWTNTQTDNNIFAEGARALSDALKVNTTLKTLNLRCEQAQEQWWWLSGLEVMDWNNEAHTLLNKHKQATALEMKEQVHWVMHWRSIQHWQHSIWNVSNDWVDWMWNSK